MPNQPNQPPDNNKDTARDAAWLLAWVIVWDSRIGRYRAIRRAQLIASAAAVTVSKGAAGYIISPKAVMDGVNKVIAASQGKIEIVTRALLDGNITVAEWQTAMAQEIKIMHTASSAAAHGGWAQMSQADWGSVSHLTRAQYKYLRDFAADVASGKQPLNGRVMQRARLYAQAARGSFEEMRRRDFTNHGFTEERRVLGVAEHCDGCVEQADKDWQPIGSLPPIGSEECRSNCKCYFEYRQASETPV